jgi:hypothetical protein
MSISSLNIGFASIAGFGRGRETPPIVKDEAWLAEMEASPFESTAQDRRRDRLAFYQRYLLASFKGSDPSGILVDEEASVLEGYPPVEVAASGALLATPLVAPHYIVLYVQPFPLAFEGRVVNLQRKVDIAVLNGLLARTIRIIVGRDVIVRGKSLTASEIHLIAGRDVCLTDVTLEATQIKIWAAAGAIKVNGLVRCICQNLNMMTRDRPAVQRVDKRMWDNTVR